MPLDADLCYRALRARDRRFDGRFFTAVLTTGIYCRPVCPARTPRREHVRFFACAAAAEAAGFRACRRCRPDSAPGTPAWSGSSAVVTRAVRLIADGALDDGDPAALAVRLGIGERHLRRLFMAHLGVPPGAIARAARAHLARRLLDETSWPITRIAFTSGFRSLRQFNDAMRASFQAAPRVLRAARPRAPGMDNAALTLQLAYRPPLDWPSMRDFLAARAIPGVECVTATSYARTIVLGDAAGTVELTPEPAHCQVRLALRVPGIADLRTAVARARRVLDLDADPVGIAAHLCRTPEFAGYNPATFAVRVPGAWDGFELAVRAILGQQVSVRAATTLAGRLAARFGTALPIPSPAGLTYMFPAPARLCEAELESIGVIRQRAVAIRELAQAVLDGRLRFDVSVELEDTVARLRAIPGIGAWTAHYVAMRACGEPDAFPAGDLGLRRALGRAGHPLDAAALTRAAEAWRPWRAYAAMHLWTKGGDHVAPND